MADKAHRLTDEKLEEMEKRLAEVLMQKVGEQRLLVNVLMQKAVVRPLLVYLLMQKASVRWQLK